jgi:hypothetical protein
MPMTSKIIHLFSNNSSVYSSRKELEAVQEKEPFYIRT